MGISGYAKGLRTGFVVISQNGQELLTRDGDEHEVPVVQYLGAIDGVGREDLPYGYDADDVPTPAVERGCRRAVLDIAEANGVQALVTDYFWTRSFADDSYTNNSSGGFISFAAGHRELDAIPAYPAASYNANTSDVTTSSSWICFSA